MKGKLTTTQTLTARQAIAGGGSGGPTTWDKVKNKPFSTVDTTGGLTIYDDTLGIDTLDTIATIDYVDSQVDEITTTLTEDYALKSEIPTVPTNVSAFNNDAGYITDTSLTPYVRASSLATVATSGNYNDLNHKPIIPEVDNKSIVLDDNGKISEAVPIYTEQVSGQVSLLEITGFSKVNSAFESTIYKYGYESPSRLSFSTDEDAYRVTAHYTAYDSETEETIEGEISGTWTYTTQAGSTTWKTGPHSTNEFYISTTSYQYDEEERGYKYIFHVGLHWPTEISSIEIYPTTLDDRYFDDEDIEEAGFTPSHTTITETINHQLPVKYIPIDNETIGTSSGKLKANIPTNVSSFTNDAGYITSSDLPQPDGTTIIDNNGVWSAVGGSGGSDVTVTQILSSGTAIADIDVDGTTTTLYAPTPTVVGITNTLSTGTAIGDLEIDGITTTLYAPAGSSVAIDNKSIVKNANDELEEAVPVYSSYEQHTYNCFNNWGTLTTYNGEDISDCAQYIYTTTHANTAKEWKFIINYDYNGSTYQMEGHVNQNTINSMWNTNINIDSNPGPVGSSFKALAVIVQGTTYGCRLQITGTLPSAINFIVFPEVPYDSTYTASTNVTEETVYKLPTKYTNVKFDSIYSGSYYPVLFEDSTNTIRGVRIGPGSNMSISKSNIWGDSDSQLLSINCNLKPSPIGGLLPTNQGSYGIGTTDVTIDSTHFKLQLLGWSNFYNSWGSGNYYLTFNYCTGNYGDQTYSITGGINCGATVDAVTLDGFEAIVDSVSYDSGTNRLEIYFKEYYRHNGGVYIYKTGSAAREIQRVNSYWLPLDNSTIIRDTTNGNIKTAIPAPPTTDGTYTLQATVSSGVVTYSWI